MTGTAALARAWHGPALLSYGFRPFFLGAALWAAAAMALWVAMLAGAVTLPTAFDPVSWHVHAFLFGYLMAVVAGFLLTAVPNWTGRLPVVGWPLGALFALWVAGRVAVAASGALHPFFVALTDLAMPVALAGVLAREIVAGKNWRNLPVLGLLGVLTAANTIFHWEAAAGGYAAQGYGARLGLAAGILMIALIGGRIVPSFTRNWLVKRQSPARPVPPMQGFDRIALAALAIALAIWVGWPRSAPAGGALILAGALHLIRLARWAGRHTGTEALVWVLHAGYGFVGLGALALGIAVLQPDLHATGTAQHLWMAGGIGLMTLAVMTRATLGHSGRQLTSGPGTTALYMMLLVSVAARVAAGAYPAQAAPLHQLSALCWIAAFAGFAALYGPALVRRRARS